MPTKYDFTVTMTRSSSGRLVFVVPGPDMLRDVLIPLHTEGVRQIAARLGETPARASLSRWRTEGYPVDREGPLVRLPCVTRLKKVYTSTVALSRWIRVLQALSEEVREVGGVKRWEKERKK